MRPRTAYRLNVLVLPLELVFVALFALDGQWLPAATMLGLLGAMTYNLVRLRRQGMHWNGPATFSELRALQRERERG